MSEPAVTTVLRADPDWAAPDTWLPMLAAYVNAVPADAPTSLSLAPGAAVPSGVVAEALTTACEVLAPDGRFADVVLHAEAPAGATPVATAEDVLRATRAAAPARDAQPEKIVAHARWAKQVRDGVQQVIDRWRFQSTPPPDDGEPLVTVRIALWGSVEPLLERALPSVLNGSWQNVEVLLCSDGPQPHAREAIAERVRDPRVRYLELPERPAYPQSPWSFWRSAGAYAVNRALDEARGHWIAPLDHDDAFTLDHIRGLVGAARKAGADFIYGQAMCEHRLGGWYSVGSAPMQHGAIAHGAVMYSRRLGHMRLDPDTWLLGEPGDWNMWRRIAALGPSMAHVESPVVMHFREKTMIEADPDMTEAELHGPAAVSDADLAADVELTDARRLLEITPRR